MKICIIDQCEKESSVYEMCNINNGILLCNEHHNECHGVCLK